MKTPKALAALITVLFLFSAASAQKAEVTLSLNEPFFDALLDSVFQNFDAPRFTISSTGADPGNTRLVEDRRSSFGFSRYSFVSGQSETTRAKSAACDESVKILRETNGVKTAVRFREGKIYVPLAFSGSYAPPFVGCVDFNGWAETNIDLEFDPSGQRLIGRVKVLNVNLNGTGGLGGSVIAKMLQHSIDRKLNPIEILKLDKISLIVPIPNTGNLRLKATGAQPEIVNGGLNVRIAYEFSKS